MTGLIPIITNSQNANAVDGRMLHQFLEVKTKYATWVNNRIKKYDFIEGTDFEAISKSLENGGRTLEYIFSIETAKELAMVENNDRGKEARRYFIKIEESSKKIADQLLTQNTIGIEKEFSIMAMTADFLKVNDNSRLQMAHKFYESHNLNSVVLPAYTDSKGALLAPKTLLERNNILGNNGRTLSSIAFNKKMVALELLEERERPSSTKGTKKYKALTEDGLKYGENQVSPQNPKEVQPLYYEGKFLELCKEIGLQ